MNMILRVVYRPTTTDLADQSMTFHDPEHVDLVEWHEDGSKVIGHTAGGVDVVVFRGTGRVNAREDTEGPYRYRGSFETFQGVTA